VLERAARGSVGDRERQVSRAGLLVGAAEGHGLRRGVLVEGQRRRGRGSRRLVVDRLDVDRDRVGGLVEVDAAIGGSAVVADLEVELGVVVAVALSAGVKVSLPSAMSAAPISWSTATSAPFFFSVPCVASDAILTAASWLAGVSLLSLKPKSLAVSV